MGVKVSHGTKTDETVNLIEFWGLHLNSFTSRGLRGHSNLCLVLFDDWNTKNSKTDQDASAWETEGLVLTDVGFC